MTDPAESIQEETTPSVPTVVTEVAEPLFAQAGRDRVLLAAAGALLLITVLISLTLSLWFASSMVLGGLLWALALCLAPIAGITITLALLAHLRSNVHLEITSQYDFEQSRQQSTSSSLFKQDRPAPEEWGNEEKAALIKATRLPSALILAAAIGLSIAPIIWAWPRTDDTTGLLGIGIVVLVLAVVGVGLATSLRQLGNTRLPGIEDLGVSLQATARLLLVLGAGAAVTGIGLVPAVILVWILSGLALIALAIAAEHLLRIVLHLVIPVDAAPEDRQPPISSALAGMLAMGSNRPAAASFRDHFGIDLGANWGVHFLKKAALPLAGTVALVAWLISSITLLQPNQRAIYERLGIAQEQALGPGFHLHLPWPFGQTRRLEFGNLHRIAVNLEVDNDAAPIPTAAEYPSAKQDHRLWSEAHGKELVFLCANRRRLPTDGDDTARVVRPFEFFSVDLSIHYRIGLTDVDARNFVYKTADHVTLVRTLAREILQRCAASMAAEEFLASNRAAFGTELQQAISQRLDDLESGLELVTLTIEAIHPPLPTAKAFDRVQTAHETVATMRASSLGRGDAQVIRAGGKAQQMLAAARADAAEKLADARTQRSKFTTDARAAEAGGLAFYLESYLTAWLSGVGDRPTTIVDASLQSGATSPGAPTSFFPLNISETNN
jgi:regulator of protease activity HflC (stomatin/prohibitin superfamily)